MGTGPARPTEERKTYLKTSLDEQCAVAAACISGADIFLLCTGAGFSADSGLAIYADVAKVDAYKDRGLEYHDICMPHWITEDPELFWGFWGQCYNDYRATAPHEGYEIINRWVDTKFRNSSSAHAIRKIMARKSAGRTGSDVPIDDEYPGAFFAFTSNVDGHHFDWFRSCEIRECHGNTELYQCGASDGAATLGCMQYVWKAPSNYRFKVDKASMLAPYGPSLDASALDAITPETTCEVSDAPCIGNVRYHTRSNMLRYLPAACGQAPNKDPLTEERILKDGFSSNHRTCVVCGGAGRPAILMFGDHGWIDVGSQDRNWMSWQQAAVDLISGNWTSGEVAMDDSADRPSLKVAVLEIGAGANVTTVRNTSENVMHNFRQAGAWEVTLVRVNPDYPLGDDEEFAPNGDYEHDVVSVMCGGLEAIQKINAIMKTTT